jgi:exodeoxyribonuclease III
MKHGFSALAFAAFCSIMATGSVWAETTLRVLSFNIWGGGANAGKPIDETVAAIKATGADIIGIQETRREGDPCTADACPPVGESVACDIAKRLGFHCFEQSRPSELNWSNAVISRYPIKGATSNEIGVNIEVEGRIVTIFNIHLDDAPYQPYQLLQIEYGRAPFLTTAAEAIESARQTRGPALDLLEKELAEARDAAAIFITGDLNEPSFRDWTTGSVNAARQPLPVEFPTTKRIESWGFQDTYRMVFPDEVAKPGFTWTPNSEATATDDHHDRIDFVFAKGASLKVDSAAIVGEKTPEADLVVTPWPSDHRATMATVRF